jgi:tetratricopeptide (TPR) repeat protein
MTPRRADTQRRIRRKGMTKKLCVGLLALACILTPALISAARANDLDDAEFASKLLHEREYLDIAKEVALEVRNRNGCSREGKTLATQVLIDAYVFEIRNATDPAQRQRLEAQIDELRNSISSTAAGSDPIADLQFRFQKVERLAGDLREAAPKDKEPLKTRAITDYEKLLADLKTEIDKWRQTASENEANMTKLMNDLNQKGQDLGKSNEFRDAKIAVNKANFYRNSVELLAGSVGFSYALFHKNLGNSDKAEEWFKDVKSRMDIYVNGTEDVEIIDRFEYKELQYDATVLLGKALQNLGKFEDAVPHFQRMLNPPPPADYDDLGKTEDGRKEVDYLKSRVREVRIEAHRCLTETYLYMGENASGAEKEEFLKDGVATAESLFIAIPDAIKTDGGKATCVAQGKALMALNRFAGALIALNKLFASEEESRLGTADKKFTGAQSIAAKEMCDIYSKAPKNLKLPSDVMFAIGMGFSWNQKFKEATYAFRDAGRNIRTELDRMHEEEALFNLGTSYYFLNCWYEATFAFLQIAEQYPSSRFIVEAINGAKTCLKEAKPQHPAEKEIEKKVIDLAGRVLDPLVTERYKLSDAGGLYNKAYDLENSNKTAEAIVKFREAAKKYMEINDFITDDKTGKPIAVDVFGESRFFAGLCFMRAFMSSEVRDTTDRDNAVNCYKQAIAWCETQTAGAEAFLKKTREIEAKSRYRAAEFLMQFDFWRDKPEREVAEEGINILAAFDTRLPGDPTYMANVRRIQLVGLLTTKQWDKADEKFKNLLQSYTRAKTDNAAPAVVDSWRLQFITASEALANQLNKEGKANENIDMDKAKEYWSRAAEYLIEWERVKLEGGGKLDFIDRLWMADIIFNSGKVAEAKTSYEKLIEQFKLNFDITKADVKKAIERLEFRFLTEKDYKDNFAKIAPILDDLKQLQSENFKEILAKLEKSAMNNPLHPEWLDLYKKTSLKPDEIDAYIKSKLRLADCAVATGDFDTGIKQYEEFIANPPEDWWAKNDKGEWAFYPFKTPSGQIEQRHEIKYITAHIGLAEANYNAYRKTKNPKYLLSASNVYGQIANRLDRDSDKVKFWNTIYIIFDISFEMGSYEKIHADCRTLARDGFLEKLFLDIPEMHGKMLEIWKKAMDKLNIKSDDLYNNEIARRAKTPAGK